MGHDGDQGRQRLGRALMTAPRDGVGFDSTVDPYGFAT